MPDITGTTLYFRPVVPEVADRMACVGARPDRALVAAIDTLTVPSLAGRIAADLLTADLPRPLHLLGFSFGGLLAFEVARILAARGERTTPWILDTLVVRELPGHRWHHQPVAEARLALAYLWYNRRSLLGRRDPEVLHRYGHIRLDLSPFPASLRVVVRGLYRAMVAYRPQPWPEGHVVSVHCDDEPYNRGAPPDLGWSRLVPAVEIVRIEADHPTLFRDPASAARVARVLRDRLLSDAPSRPTDPP